MSKRTNSWWIQNGRGSLKVGEFVESDGVRITVVESGDFGDIVKVEKIN